MSHVELGICGPSGVRPMKESGPDLILMGIGAAVFILAFVVTGRALRAPGSSDALSFGAVAVAGLALAAWAILRMWRRQDDAALMEAGMLSFIFFLGLHEKAPKGSPLALFAALLPLAPAALFAWSTIRIARRADELQRRIAQEALAFGFVVSLFAALAGAALEAAGLPRLNWVWMAGVLVLTCGVGMVLANRRYR